MQVNSGIGLSSAIEARMEEDTEEAAKEQAALVAGISPEAASLKATESVLPGDGVVLAGLGAIAMPEVMRPVDVKPEPNKLLAKVFAFQDRQQAQVFAEMQNKNQREAKNTLATYDTEVKRKETQATEVEEAEQQDNAARNSLLSAFIDAIAEKLSQVGFMRLNNGDGSSVLWKTRQDGGGETVLQQVLTSFKRVG